VVYISPVAWHVPMALRRWERGKHAFVEVAAAVTVDDCWKLGDTSERTAPLRDAGELLLRREELFVLKHGARGVFGELTTPSAPTSTTCAACCSRSAPKATGGATTLGVQRQPYPTHGLGPVAQYMGVGRATSSKTWCR